MKACRHPISRRERYVWRIGGGDVSTWFNCASFERPDVEFCLVCDAYLPLEPSNDSTAAVRHEIKLAAHIADVCRLWEPGREQTELIGRYVEGFASHDTTTKPQQGAGDE